MMQNDSTEENHDNPGMLGHLLLILLAFCLILFNEISGFFFQNIFYSYSFIFYFLLFFITVQHYVLYTSLTNGVDTEAGGTTGTFRLNKTRQYKLSALVYRVEPQAAFIVLSICWFLQVYLLKKPALYPTALPQYPELFAVVSALLAISASVLFKYVATVSKKTGCRELSAILPYLALTVILTAANAIGIILTKFGLTWAAPFLKTVIIAFNFIILFEYTTNTVINFYSEKKYPFDITPLYNAIILTALLAPGKRGVSFADMVENRFGIRIHNIWVIGFLKKSFFPLMICQAILLWSLTCFIVINPEENGIRERFGRRVSLTALPPGLYLKLPFPLEKIIKFNTKQVKTITIGYEGDRTVRNLFWSTAHFKKAYNFCLGEGRELITVNVDIHYLIDDIFDYHYQHSDPVSEMKNIGYAAFTGETVHRNIQEVLSLDRNHFIMDIRTEIEERVASARLGTKIINVSMNEIHPPSVVANAYQEVISSKIKAVALTLNAERDAIKKILAFTKAAKTAVNKANIYQNNIIAAALGEVSSFLEKYQAYQISPGLFKKRLYLDTIETQWMNSDVTIIDHTLQSENKQELWLYLGGEPKGNE